MFHKHNNEHKKLKHVFWHCSSFIANEKNRFIARIGFQKRHHFADT